LMRANPHLLTGMNKLWVKFFLLAVYATMYVRDHARPEFHKALGIDPTEYDYKVFHLTSEISKQVFPLTLDVDHPVFRRGFEKLRVINEKLGELQDNKSFTAGVKRKALAASAGTTFLRMFMHRTVENQLPQRIRMEPVW
jgi:magnesium-protoporphyrin IX monomethyl ester (oxidative) cyclase